MSKTNGSMAALNMAIKKAGGKAALARRIDVKRQAIQQWLTNGVPADRCADVERVTGVKREKLRPDIFT